MNIIEPGVKLDPNTTKLVHCKSCDATFADKKIPKVCPNCGADKKKLAGAKDDDCESFMEAYAEMLAEYAETMSNEEADTDSSEDGTPTEASSFDTDPYSSDYEISDEPGQYSDDPSSDQSSSYDTAYEEEIYEPIGYNPDDFLDNMSEKKKISGFEKKMLLEIAEQSVREKKWALQRVGLPTDGLQNVLQDIRQSADKLGKNIPGYTDLMLKMYVDQTLQHELRHPRKGRQYSISDINHMLQELNIRQACWESYYNIAGLDDRAEHTRLAG